MSEKPDLARQARRYSHQVLESSRLLNTGR
jgi:hypothetical protein